jgi:nucleotide-binding universal stress UspA family protein
VFRNILVAIDGSPDAEEALGHAIDLADCEHARLTIFSAVPTPPGFAYATPGGAALADLAVRAEQETEAIIRSALDRVPESVSVTTVLGSGPAKNALLRQIKEGRHDIVVMGSRGRGAVRAALLGSVSHHVLHHSGVPVLITHSHLPPDAEREIVAPAAAA